MQSIVKFLPFPFLIGLVAAQKIVIVGEIYFGEIMAAIYLMVVVANYRFEKTERTLSILAFCWCGAQIASDFYNQTNLAAALKGTLAPVIFISTLMAATIYFRKQRERIPAFLLGVSIGALINQFVFPKYFSSGTSEYFTDNPWKWGVGGTVLTVFSIWYSFYYKRGSIFLILLFLVTFAIPTIYLQARGMALFPLIAAAGYIFLRSRWGARMHAEMQGNWGSLKFGLLALLFGVGINAVASYVFSSKELLSYFKPDDAEKYRTQANGTYGILLGGRSEILVSVSAFLDKPLLGHGSWAEDKTGEYFFDYVDRMDRLNYGTEGGGSQTEVSALIPAHSFLFGALMWGGIVAGFFWIYTLGLIWNRFLRAAPLLPFYFVNGTIGIIWSIFFSPFGAATRWDTGIYLAAFLIYSEKNGLAAAVDRPRVVVAMRPAFGRFNRRR